MPFQNNEGPYGLIICPSVGKQSLTDRVFLMSNKLQRELATQTFEVIKYYTSALSGQGYPYVRTVLMIGGLSVKDQADSVRRYGKSDELEYG